MADDPSDQDPAGETDISDEVADTSEGGEDAAREDADDEGDAKASSKPVARKKVVSKRVTPKGGSRSAGSSSTAASTRSKRGEDGDDVSFSSGRYTPPSSRSNAQLPSPWWVPALMFAFLVVGALVIMLNYMVVFGDAENIRLIIGLALILAGIITATQYR